MIRKQALIKSREEKPVKTNPNEKQRGKTCHLWGLYMRVSVEGWNANIISEATIHYSQVNMRIWMYSFRAMFHEPLEVFSTCVISSLLFTWERDEISCWSFHSFKNCKAGGLGAFQTFLGDGQLGGLQIVGGTGSFFKKKCCVELFEENHRWYIKYTVKEKFCLYFKFWCLNVV